MKNSLMDKVAGLAIRIDDIANELLDLRNAQPKYSRVWRELDDLADSVTSVAHEVEAFTDLEITP